MTAREKLEYARLRLAGAVRFEQDPAEAESWRKAIRELEKEAQ